MGLKQEYILKVGNVAVFTNLEVRLKTRTTKEEANKEVERMLGSKNLFENYDWKIEGCPDGGINDFSEKLRDDIIERIEQEDTEDCIDWDGFNAGYEMCIAHIAVETDLEVSLKSQNREDAVNEVKKMCEGKNLFSDYEWKVSGCSEQGINTLDDQLQKSIINRIKQQGRIEDYIEEGSN
jgi:hypothetical protein